MPKIVSYIAYIFNLKWAIISLYKAIDMNTNVEVKNRILALCEEKGMTINKLATESGLSPSSLKNILYGKSKNPGIITLKMICDGFGISLYEFFNTESFKMIEN